MLDEAFLTRLSGAFPEFYTRVDQDARTEAAALLDRVGGDVGKALVRARFTGAARIWWPYVKGSLPIVRPERDAMEGFSHLVLTVDHVVGYSPANMEAARDHVIDVLRKSLDVERLADVIRKREDEEKAALAAGAGMMASLAGLVRPVTLWRKAKKWSRWLPAPARVAAAAVVLAAVASVPLVVGLSAGHKAETAARAAAGPVVDIEPKAPAPREEKVA